MNPKKGLVGKEVKPGTPGGAKHGMGKSDLTAKPALGGGKPALSKEPPTKGAASRNLLSLEDVADRLRVDARHVEIWIKDGILKGSVQGIQLYELEKFRAKHHRDIQQAQHAPPPPAVKSSKPQKSQGKKPAATPPAKEKTPAPNPFSLVAAAIKSVVSATLGLNRPPKPAKVAPYVRPAEMDDDDPFSNAPSNHPTMIQRSPVAESEPLFSANAMATANIPATAFQAAVATGELTPPAPPSSEVWPSLEGNIPDPSKTPSWLTTSVEQPSSQHETLIMRADQIMSQMKAAPPPQPPAPSGGNPSLARELQEEKQRNQQLLLQLQDQRRAELEVQDEVETLKQRLELSLTSEREIRSQLKRSRQELQTALEELEQRPPAGGADPEAERLLQEREAQWANEKTILEQQRAQLDQRRTLLEQQIERLRTQAEEIRQHGLQWHQLATQQDQQLRSLRQQHLELEQEAGKALGELEKKVREAETQRARAETAAEQSQARLAQLEDISKHTETGSLQQELRNKERTITQLQQVHEQMQARLATLEGQQRTQIQRWEQELQASASWVQKLTEAVAARDRRIQELESQVAQSATRHHSVGEEELKSQVMSLRVELTSLRRNYEIVTLQAKNLENQLQESRRAQPPVPPQPLAGPAAAPVLSLEIPGTALAAPTSGSGEEEGGFRRRLKQRLGTLGPSFEEDSKKRGLEPPPFLELDIPES